MFILRREERFGLSVYPTDPAVDDRLEHSHKSQQPQSAIRKHYYIQRIVSFLACHISH
jgi:hypothetical protein